MDQTEVVNNLAPGTPPGNTSIRKAFNIRPKHTGQTTTSAKTTTSGNTSTTIATATTTNAITAAATHPVTRLWEERNGKFCGPCCIIGCTFPQLELNHHCCICRNKVHNLCVQANELYDPEDKLNKMYCSSRCRIFPELICSSARVTSYLKFALQNSRSTLRLPSSPWPPPPAVALPAPQHHLHLIQRLLSVTLSARIMVLLLSNVLALAQVHFRSPSRSAMTMLLVRNAT